jgi:hypothetical protein
MNVKHWQVAVTVNLLQVALSKGPSLKGALTTAMVFPKILKQKLKDCLFQLKP